MKTDFNQPAPVEPPATKALSLAGLVPGTRAVVMDIDTGSGLRRRLLDLGFVPGTPVRVLRRAPLGDPILYEIRGMQLCLRETEARHIRVRVVAGEAP